MRVIMTAPHRSEDGLSIWGAGTTQYPSTEYGAFLVLTARVATDPDGELTPTRDGLTASESQALQAQFEVLTKAQLIAKAENNALRPAATYRTTDGVCAYAITERFLQPMGPWYADGRRWSVGAATSPVDLAYTYLPPLAPNAQVEIYSQWSVDPNTNTKRARLYLDGTLGGGISGAQDVYIRNINGSGDKGLNLYTRIANRNDQASQMCLTQGDGSSFAITVNDFISRTVSTNTSKLLRAMGETSKTGTNVAITSLTRSGTTATAVTGAAHNLTTGDFIGVAGATPAGYNVDPAQITVVDSTTFTYQLSADPGSNASGSPVYQKYNKCELLAFRVQIYQGL